MPNSNALDLVSINIFSYETSEPLFEGIVPENMIEIEKIYSELASASQLGDVSVYELNSLSDMKYRLCCRHAQSRNLVTLAQG